MLDPNYSATAFLAEDSEFSIDGIFDYLSKKYDREEKVSVVRDEFNVQVDFGSWFLNIAVTENGSDPVGDQEIINHRKPVPAELDVAGCLRRVKIQSADPYPNMDHFNDFLRVCERICDAYDGTFIRDDASGTWF